ncbi:hypothetical protein C8R46DRAFT_1190779 [Mycena filopes]|nr:hypothetical protein C8R46DRAFT_1190779 [Mycena filopes]
MSNLSSSKTPKPLPSQLPPVSQPYERAEAGPSDIFFDRLGSDVPPLGRPEPPATLIPGPVATVSARAANEPPQHTPSPSQAFPSSGAPIPTPIDSRHPFLGYYTPPFPHTPYEAPGAFYSDSPASSSASLISDPASGDGGQMTGSSDSLARSPGSGVVPEWRRRNLSAASLARGGHRRGASDSFDPPPRTPDSGLPQGNLFQPRHRASGSVDSLPRTLGSRRARVGSRNSFGHGRNVSGSSDSLPPTPDSEFPLPGYNSNAPVRNSRQLTFASPSTSDTSDSLPHTPDSGPGLLPPVTIGTAGSGPDTAKPHVRADNARQPRERPRPLKYRKGQVGIVKSTTIFTPLFLACFEAAPEHVSGTDLSAYQDSLKQGKSERPCIIAEDVPIGSAEDLFPKVFLMTTLNGRPLEHMPAAMTHWMVPVATKNTPSAQRTNCIETWPPWSKNDQWVIACAFRPANLRIYQNPTTQVDASNFARLCGFSVSLARTWRALIAERNRPVGSSWRLVPPRQYYPQTPVRWLIAQGPEAKVVEETIQNYGVHAIAVPFEDAELTEAKNQLKYHRVRAEVLRKSNFIPPPIRRTFVNFHESRMKRMEVRIAAADFNIHGHNQQAESMWGTFEMTPRQAEVLCLPHNSDGVSTRAATPEDDPMPAVDATPEDDPMPDVEPEVHAGGRTTSPVPTTTGFMQKLWRKTASLPAKFFGDNSPEAPRKIKPLPARAQRIIGAMSVGTNTSERKRTMSGEATMSIEDKGTSSLM